MIKENKLAGHLLYFFGGYCIGRVGHVYAREWTENCKYGKGLHHWILGAGVTGLGAYLKLEQVTAFGVGLFVSDFGDFTKFRIKECANVKRENFWGLD